MSPRETVTGKMFVLRLHANFICPSGAYDELALMWSASFIAFIDPTTLAEHHLQTPVVKPTMRSLIVLFCVSQNSFISNGDVALAVAEVKPRPSRGLVTAENTNGFDTFWGSTTRTEHSILYWVPKRASPVSRSSSRFPMHLQRKLSCDPHGQFRRAPF